MESGNWITYSENQPFLVQFAASIGSSILDILVMFRSKGDTENISLYVLKDDGLHYLLDGDISLDLEDAVSLLDYARMIIEASEKEILDFIAKTMDYDTLDR